ncbi:3-O-alpha-D-mannopyranosyl-alpha-D-mannopyranose xylosylphosphotransferase [Cyphellophora attinorum]|uniref:3-O-alpha-D-mannopyranosyl-alpha-D-mannopyranose xylosylphosphotransferase n=1 Tax=Cyphellophora attinorum TaxID=1664694 RepID=A0A0N1P183_9EURO|nr:3-O-alpha-D-mannopyranosyl-alpha-D-mannopyranose xylosylphosphotransferase [Phialophora attinorum]KPI41667.1 3-O-alpha-D-mannopyranosyl-alpha-D-mannopyranose xylosylphosphotransferase [Phialophora attinorum]
MDDMRDLIDEYFSFEARQHASEPTDENKEQRREDQPVLKDGKSAQSQIAEEEDDEQVPAVKHKNSNNHVRAVEGGLVIGKEDSPLLEHGNSQESDQHLSLEAEAELLPDFVYMPFEGAVEDEHLDGWEDRWLSEGFYDLESYGTLSEPSIDFLYLWVNGSEDAFREVKLPWEQRSVLNDADGKWIASHSTNRYRDWNELRYSLRSVHRNAGHFRNNIQVLVNSLNQQLGEGSVLHRQSPKWLKTPEDHNIQVLAQEDFFDKKTAACLPTFNSLTIENQLFNVPSDADQLFALSDDMLLGARHAPSDIYSPLFGPVMGFKNNGYSTTSPPTQQDAQRFGEKPYLIYTSWLLNRRFGIRKRKGQSHFGHSISRKVMREALTSFPRPEFRSACKRFRGEGFQIYSWYVTFHYLIERHREVLLWSYLVLRSDLDGDGVLSWPERQAMLDDLARGTENLAKASYRRRTFYHVPAMLERAGLAPPQVNTNLLWTSLDGPVAIRDANCEDFDVDDCLAPGFGLNRSSSVSNPLFSSAVIFDRVARQNPHCGDCLLKIVLHQTRQGLAPLLPVAGSKSRDTVVKALMKYKYTIMDPTNSLFVMVTDADQVDSTLVEKYIRQGKELPGQLCLNDDVSTTDLDELEDTREAITELLQGIFPEKAAWEW